jgi:hypothetical protein
VILLPTHACLADASGAVAYGELDGANVATCIVRVQWETGTRHPGCGSRLAVCFGCGLRTRTGETPPPCEACGATQRPEVMQHESRERGAVVLAAPVADPGPRVAAVGPASDAAAGSRRPTETKAPSKPRAPQKRLKKGAAPSDEPTLPGVK